MLVQNIKEYYRKLVFEIRHGIDILTDMKHGPCVDKVRSGNNFLTTPTPSENLIQKPVLERSSLAFYSRIGLIRARQRFELIFHLPTRLKLNANDDDQKHLETMYAFESGNPTQNDTSRVINRYPKISRQFNGLKIMK